MAVTDSILELRDVSKAFGGLRAVDNVRFSVARGSITGLIGPNGAGKSTLFNLISGTLPVTSGEIVFEGKLIQRMPAFARVSLGIARTFQGVELFGNMSALENVMVGRHPKTKAGLLDAMLRLPRHRREEREIADSARRTLEFVGLAAQMDTPALSLPFGQQRLLAIARALASDPKLLLLDEPGAGLNNREKHHLADLIRDLRAKGLTILLVEHDMELVMGVTEHVVVLDFGQQIAEGSPAEIQADERVIVAYLGEDVNGDLAGGDR